MGEWIGANLQEKIAEVQLGADMLGVGSWTLN